MPGFLTGFAEVMTGWKSTLVATTHDASTLGGNSGSAVLDLTAGQVLALHFGGRYRVANYGVPAWELAQDRRIVELGVSFADPAAAIPVAAQPRAVWLSAWERVRPLVAEEVPAPAGESALPVAPDCFERVSDNDLVEAMRRDAPATERLIRQTLPPAEAEDLIADLRRGLEQGQAPSAAEGIVDFLLGAGKVDLALPEIVFLHGIMASHLSATAASAAGSGCRRWRWWPAGWPGGSPWRTTASATCCRTRCSTRTGTCVCTTRRPRASGACAGLWSTSSPTTGASRSPTPLTVCTCFSRRCGWSGQPRSSRWSRTRWAGWWRRCTPRATRSGPHGWSRPSCSARRCAAATRRSRPCWAPTRCWLRWQWSI